MTSETIHHAAVRLERTLPAPPHAVYRAWLDPDQLRRWLAPGDQEITRVEIDERAGGPYRTWKANVGPGWEAVFTKLERLLAAAGTSHCVPIREGRHSSHGPE